MFCKYCGNEINEKAIVCPHCGVAVNNTVCPSCEQKTNVLAIVGLIMAFFMPIAGLVCSIIGYKKEREYTDNSKPMALAGIIISSIIMGIIFIILSIYFSLVVFLIGAFSSMKAF